MIQVSNKIGRNESCPCGSGLKYKRCCLDKDQQQGRQTVEGNKKAASSAGQNAVPVTAESMIKWIRELPWKRTEDQQLAELLVEHMHGTEPSIIVRAVWVWHCYADETAPAYTKPEVYCAAIEYLMSEAHGLSATQKGLAAKYGVSPTTLSKRYRELAAFFEDRAADAATPKIPEVALA
ncbi:SEC-C domain-containing protein [Paenibacillus sp. PR3]|uniref:SEC-C domain-containing protein n=1 Tax=Paenibacillus terricola TaxID=2763503 RepID=A0ABR8MN70_9BACL|nr:SEC-C metal-binding domain-containing protein [Paenibacillus terricola]MBD3917468.1 SEC-C domain-containing protein [Paenibacillus terricola]